MACPEITDYLLLDYIEGSALSEEETLQIERHLLECSICRKEEQELRILLAAVAALPKTEEPQRDLWPAIAAQIAEPDQFLTELAEALALRQVDIATTLISKHFDAIVELDPSHKNAATLLDYFTQWMDISGSAHRSLMPYPSYSALVRACLARFPRSPRPFLRLVDCVHLHMIEGFLAMRAEEYDHAISNFSWVLSPSVQQELGDWDLVAVAGGAVAKAYSRKGAYNDALPHADEAIAIALASKRKELAAAIGVVKGWIMFQLKNSTQAIQILQEAESVLLKTDDHLALGNIKAAFGRILKRDGRYKDALRCYIPAIDQYKRCDTEAQHPNLARALMNQAFLKRVLARRLDKNKNLVIQGSDIEKEARISERRDTGGESAQQLRQAASEDLVQASMIYSRLQDYRGRGSVLLVSALLRFDDGDLEGAALELLEAYTLGRERTDHILMARARIEQSMLENARAEARLGNEAIPGSYAESARSLAEDAITLSEKTQNPRLIAHSYIWCGIALLDAYMLDSERARQSYEKAAKLLDPEPGRDIVWDDLQVLKKKLVRAGYTDLAPSEAEPCRALSAAAK